jgi:hypothetical protein
MIKKRKSIHIYHRLLVTLTAVWLVLVPTQVARQTAKSFMFKIKDARLRSNSSTGIIIGCFNVIRCI